MSGVHYCFIAKDSDMIIFERVVNKELSADRLKQEAIELISGLERQPEDRRPEYQKESFPNVTSAIALEGHFLFDIVWIGLVTTINYDETKARRFLGELHSALARMYANNLPFIKR